MRPKTLKKLQILAEAARYDVSCASSGSRRKNTRTGLGNSSGMGICHTYTEDGRCVSLLKLLLTNHCIYDCAYCVCRRSANTPRAAFTVEEVVALTWAFYQRNYIEGLFLSSGIFKDADTTSERLIRVASTLRGRGFHGYIHLKVIPGTSPELLLDAGRYADRLSVNLEIASEPELQRVAPEKDHASALVPMHQLHERIAEDQEAQAAYRQRRTRARPPRFAPGGQSTQLIVGATHEDDRTILGLADQLYQEASLKRVYYSGYIPVSADARVPQQDQTPLVREHRLYQADWLLRRYGFAFGDLLGTDQTHLDLDIDPKAAFALRNPHLFPVDVNTAAPLQLLQVPGIGARSVQRIVRMRRLATVRWEDLHRMGVALTRAQHFITVPNHQPRLLEQAPQRVRLLLSKPQRRPTAPQLSLFPLAASAA